MKNRCFICTQRFIKVRRTDQIKQISFKEKQSGDIIYETNMDIDFGKQTGL